MPEAVPKPAQEAPAPKKRPRGRPVHVVPSEIYEKRKDEIVAAAQRIFATKGYTEASLDDVAKAINLSKPTLYYYFPSKAHLFYHLTNAKAEEANARLAELSVIKDPRAHLIQLMRFQVEQLTGDPQFYRYFFDHRPPLNNKRLKAELRERLQQYSQYFYDAVKAAIEAGVLPTVDVFLATQAIFGATFWMYKWFDPKRFDADAVLDQFLIMINVQPETRPSP